MEDATIAKLREPELRELVRIYRQYMPGEIRHHADKEFQQSRRNWARVVKRTIEQGRARAERQAEMEARLIDEVDPLGQG